MIENWSLFISLIIILEPIKIDEISSGVGLMGAVVGVVSYLSAVKACYVGGVPLVSLCYIGPIVVVLLEVFLLGSSSLKSLSSVMCSGTIKVHGNDHIIH
jgi:hypothetical protein